MITFAIPLLASGVCGVVLGAVVARGIVKRRIFRELHRLSVREWAMQHSAAFVTDNYINSVAGKYASARGRPMVAPLIARHLRAWRSADQERLRRAEKERIRFGKRRWWR